MWLKLLEDSKVSFYTRGVFMLHLSKNVRSAVYKSLGLELNIQELNNFDYENINKSINMGIKFKEICEQLGLNSNKVRRYLIKYVLHQLYEYSLDLSPEERGMLDKFGDEPIGDITFADVTVTEFFYNPKEYMEYYTKPLLEKNNEQDKEKIAIRIFPKASYLKTTFKSLENDQNYDPNWFNYSKKSGSFLPLYFDYAQSHRIPLNKQAHKISNINKDFGNFVKNTTKYLDILEEYDEDGNCSEDILRFERKTGLLFSLKSSLLLSRKKMH